LWYNVVIKLKQNNDLQNKQTILAYKNVSNLIKENIFSDDIDNSETDKDNKVENNSEVANETKTKRISEKERLLEMNDNNNKL